MGLFGFGSKKENRTSSSANNGQELARRFQSQSDWSGMTLGEFRKALEFAIRQGVYSGASDQQWAQILPMYKNEIEYALYAMGATQFPFSDQADWSVEDFNRNMARKTLDSNAKHNFFVGYMNCYFYRYIHSVELNNLRMILTVNEGIPMDYAVDYFLTLIIFNEVVAANPGQQFEYHQIQGVPASRVQALEELRNKIIVAYNNDDEPALFKHIYYAMTYFSGSTYRGVHKAAMALLGHEDMGAVREMFNSNVENLIKNQGNVSVGRVTL